MRAYYIAEGDFATFVDAMIAATRVVAPVAKRSKFVYADLDSAADLRLDFDTTILPPKKVFFPPTQPIVRFDGEVVADCIAPVPTVLLGVHFYDVKGIDQTDVAYGDLNADADYLAQRAATTIVASNIRAISPRAFWDSIGLEIEPKGHDAFLTRLEDGYVYEPSTPKGEALLAHGTFRDATDAEVEAARQVNAGALGRCPERIPYTSEQISRTVRDSFGNEKMWDSLALDCFSCGSCNTVCPTCYCFDVRDSWNVDQTSGTRTRYWDACLTREFAAITGPGGQENFREHHQARFRHRFMRKAAYLYDKLGGPACVGCGRCSQACTANIADPVRVITAIMEWQS